jgi:peptide/nickel transport system ATP-binding protein
LLEVTRLTIDYRSRDGSQCRAVNDVSLAIAPGTTLGLLGESGSGKTTLALALVGIFSPNAVVVAGSVRFRNEELLHRDERQLRKIRGKEIAVVFQEPELSLNPVIRAGDQVAEVVRAHTAKPWPGCREDARNALAEVQLPGARFFAAYPHQLSAGQRQRVAIAQALVCRPSLLIADEPTSALDNDTQADILDLLKELKIRRQLAILFITHIPSVLAGFADRACAMHAGRIVEDGSLSQVLKTSKYPYGKTLRRAPPKSSFAPLLRVENLRKRYGQGRWYSKEQFQVTALDGVCLAVNHGSTLALVGESGAGKSTLAKCVALLEKPDSGEIQFDGKNLRTLSAREVSAIRGRIQMIFQDSASALTPHFSAAQIIEEPLRIRTRLGKKERRQRALAMMDDVGLSPAWADRTPLEFSGGERQRLAIARALIIKPDFLILDESLARLDITIQAQIVNLLLNFQSTLSLTYLFITHDIRLAAYFADEIAVMQNSRIIESGGASEIFSNPKTAYTRRLIAAIPNVETDATR